MEDIDIDQFTSLIKTKESIWNYKSTAYANKAQRKEDWLSVCEGLIPNFGEKTNEDKNSLVVQYQTKWRVLRDGFTRSVKNYNETGGKGKLYLYYEQLHFLHDLYDVQAMAIRHKSAKRRKLLRNHLIAQSSEDLEHPRSVPDKVKTCNRIPENIEENVMEEDKQFLLSLLSDFRKIPEDQKLDAKGDIINVIRHYRNTTIQFEPKYYNDITPLPATATGSYYEHTMMDDCSRGSSSPTETKYTAP